MIASLILALLAGENASRPGELTLERPTYICLGVRWLIHGDDNKNAAVSLEYRKAGAEAWKKALPLFRVESAACRKKPPEGAWLFAGSVFDLEEGTEYELRLVLNDPDGGEAEKVVRARTRKEPFAPPDMRVRHVVPGSGGGDGTEGNPFRGLNGAAQAAKPGDLFLVHKGVYPATWTVKTSGTEARPIVWRGAGDGEAVIDGAHAEKRPGRGISADVEAHSSLRIMPAVMCIGQAAGIAAAMSLPAGRVRDIDVQGLRQRIRDAGGVLEPVPMTDDA